MKTYGMPGGLKLFTNEKRVFITLLGEKLLQNLFTIVVFEDGEQLLFR